MMTDPWNPTLHSDFLTMNGLLETGYVQTIRERDQHSPHCIILQGGCFGFLPWALTSLPFYLQIDDFVEE